MSMGQVAGAAGLTPRVASAAMALITAATEPRHEIVGFFVGEGGVDFGLGRSARFAHWQWFSIADPTDSGMLDVVGFDTATPAVIGGFANGDI